MKCRTEMMHKNCACQGLGYKTEQLVLVVDKIKKNLKGINTKEAWTRAKLVWPDDLILVSPKWHGLWGVPSQQW